MKLTYETLRDLYLKDLTLPDTHHGRTTPKTRYIDSWKAVNSRVLSERINLNALAPDTNVWIWSDTHFGHNNIIKYTGRPFVDVRSMNEAMINNFLNTVKRNDVVIWTGDLAFMSKEKMNAVLDMMPGYHIQIVGNHDMERDGSLIDFNVNERHLCYVLDVVDGDKEFQLLFTHYPLDNVPKNCVNVCGHIHEKHANPWNIIVCVEHTNYTPINLKTVVEKARLYLDKK